MASAPASVCWSTQPDSTMVGPSSVRLIRQNSLTRSAECLDTAIAVLCTSVNPAVRSAAGGAMASGSRCRVGRTSAARIPPVPDAGVTRGAGRRGTGLVLPRRTNRLAPARWRYGATRPADRAGGPARRGCAPGRTSLPAGRARRPRRAGTPVGSAPTDRRGAGCRCRSRSPNLRAPRGEPAGDRAMSRAYLQAVPVLCCPTRLSEVVVNGSQSASRASSRCSSLSKHTSSAPPALRIAALIAVGTR